MPADHAPESMKGEQEVPTTSDPCPQCGHENPESARQAGGVFAVIALLVVVGAALVPWVTWLGFLILAVAVGLVVWWLFVPSRRLCPECGYNRPLSYRGWPKGKPAPQKTDTEFVTPARDRNNGQ
jgi:hypothetical protein